MARFSRRGRRQPREVPGALSPGTADGTRPRKGRRRTAHGADRLHQHDPAGAGAVVPRRRVHRAPDPRVHPLERRDDGRPREPPLRRSGRPPVDVRVGRRALRGRLQPLLPRQGRRRLRRPGVLPGTRRARHLHACVPRRSHHRRPARPLPSRGERAGPAVVSAPAPAARVLGVPDGVDGPRPDRGRVPGPAQPLPLQPASRRHVERARVVLRR